ncbi:MAG: DUF1573 domain-containing protein, partial [Candidatus Pacebacteria bacterium]|nr:DUF1573 domain-containing protein [Candidatus Paceibacterota bacterium]
NGPGSGTGVLEVISENDFDFGEILMQGGFVRHNFTLKNTGDGPITIQNAETSCACTVANIVNQDGDALGPFGMQGGGHTPNPKINMEILPGEEVVVETIYDPLKHGPDATGEIIREVFLSTDAGTEVSLKFRGVGVKEFTKVTGPSLIFTNKEYDFGLVKQSQGIVTTEFTVVNNGTETVIVNSLPASCECTQASIDKKVIGVGESATITVAFDANLHPEPDGRFFKTIELVSNVVPSPEFRMYANVEYDLGMDKLKLQEHDEVDDHIEEVDGHSGAGFKSISSAELENMLANKDFTLIDVHIPGQEHVPGTDYMISYEDIEKVASVIPSKNSKVVLYCRSGNMSKRTAKGLVEMGYTNVIELGDGMNEWISENRETVPKGSISNL